MSVTAFEGPAGTGKTHSLMGHLGARMREQPLAPQSAWMLRGPLFAAGAVLLFGYGLSVNLAPVEFGRVAGLYIATLFVVWQLVNWIVFRSPPVAPILVGGALIVAGGAIVTFWK
jgi:hypothetical protein